MNTIKKILLLTTAITALMLCFVFSSSAATSGKYTYEVEDGAAVIIDVDESISGNITIPSKLGGYPVVSVAGFYDCNNVTSVTVPDGVKYIYRNAFYSCDNLKSITLPDSVCSIGDGAFRGTAFYNNKNNWEKGVLYIGRHLIVADVVSSSYTVKSGTVTIADDAFNYSGDYDDSPPITTLATTYDPDSKPKPDNSIILNSKAVLKTITIPSSVKNIGSGVFGSCYSIKKVCATSISSWMKINFAENSSNPLSWGTAKLYIGGEVLRDLVVPESITSIKPNVFYGCNSLKSITLHSGVKSVGADAFISCPSLNKFYVSDIKSWLKLDMLGNLTTGGVDNSRKLYVGGKLIKNLTIPSSVTSIPYRSFQDFDCIETVTIPKTVKSINNYAFEGCKNLKTINYKGTDKQWAEIEFIHSATVKYASVEKPSATISITSSTAPTYVKLSWEPVLRATGYRVLRKTSSGWSTVVTATSKLSCTIKSLSPNKNYTFAVRAYIKHNDKIIWSDKYKTITVTTKLSTPTLKLASTAKGRATVAWTNVAGETGYQVYYATSKTGTYKKIANYKANTTKIYKTGLTSGKTYYFKVRAYTNTDTGYVYSAYSPVKGIKIK